MKNDLQFVFMGDSYTVGWGLWYYYWCENKLYDHIKYKYIHFCKTKTYEKKENIGQFFL